MKILFFISVMSHGRGGHAHSLNHISLELGAENNVGIVTVGIGTSEVLKGNPYFLKHISFTGFNYFSFRKNIMSVCKDFNAEVLHFFDYQSYILASLLLNTRNYKMILTKCGGANPLDFPFVDNLILFSLENEKWFKDRSKFKATKIYTIPNRVRSIKVGKSSELDRFKGIFTFMRIARIGETYKKGIMDSIRLIQALNLKLKEEVKLLIVGTVQDPRVYDELVKARGNDFNIMFFVDDIYTQEASRHLNIADAVIATGRGVMEAASLGKPILTPAKNSTFPILITKRNFPSFFKTNFSERNLVEREDEISNLSNILNLIRSNVNYAKCSNYSISLFNEYFNVANVKSKYLKIYNDADKSQRSFFIKDLNIYITTLLSFVKSYIKTIKT